MSSFDYFSFMTGRRNAIEPTEEDKTTFNLYMCQMLLSMDTRKSILGILDKVNTLEFFDLPKPIQCMAFTTLDGASLNLKWKKSKSESKNETKDLVEKVMKVYNISHNDAVSCVRCKTINEDVVNELYTVLYETDTIKFRKGKSKEKE